MPTKQPPDEILPWDQPAEGETARAFAAFTVYRDLGPTRSLRRAAGLHYRGETPARTRQLETWSSRHRWADRVAAFDRWLDAQVIARRREEHLEMAARHAAAGRSALELVADQLGQLAALEAKRLQLLDDAGDDPDPQLLRPIVPVQSLARLLDVGVKVERISAGLATEIEQQVPVEEMTDEELERILEGDDVDDDVEVAG